MRRARSIRTTLLSRLFGRPTPLNPKLYAQASSELFPGAEDFVRFLKADDDQSLVACAKDIILHLVYHHHFPVPYSLLLNLLSAQEKESGHPIMVRPGEYVPQDHFVHLVHLYLLGIYLFAYHRTLHEACCADLHRLKRKFARTVQCFGEGPSNYELFASLWAHFVLYHDAAYPLERVLPRDRQLQQADGILRPFGALAQSLNVDLALKAIARLAVLHFIIPTRSDATLGTMYTDHADAYWISSIQGVTRGSDTSGPESPHDRRSRPNGSTARSACNEREQLFLDLRSAVYLPRVTDRDTIRTLLSFLPTESVCAVLENVVTGQPLALVRAGIHRGTTIWFQPKEERPSDVVACSARLAQHAFNDGMAPSRSLVWRYFAVNARHEFEERLRELIGDRHDDLKLVIRHLEGVEQIQAARLATAGAVADLGYAVFKTLATMFAPHSESGEPTWNRDRKLKEKKAAIASVEQRIPSLVSECVSHLLVDHTRDKRFNARVLVSGSQNVSEVARRIVEYMNRERVDLCQRIQRAIEPAIQRSSELREAANSCMMLIRERHLKPHAPRGNIRSIDPFHDSKFDEVFALESLLDDGGELQQTVDVRLGQLQLGDFKTLVREFVPIFAARPEYRGASVVDHGFAATVLLLSAVRSLEGYVSYLVQNSGPDVPPNVKLLRLAFGVISKEEDRWLDAEGRMLTDEVATTVALHNLYPNQLRTEQKRAYRTDMLTQPFAYLALLADGLQRWDRSRQISQAMNQLTGTVPGTRFDLEIVDGRIHIWATSHRMSMAEEESKLRTSLGDYLKEVNLIVRLELAEERP